MRRVLALLVLLGACGGARAPVASSRVVLSEGVIAVETPVWVPGTVRLDVVNEGEFGHTLVIAAADGTVVAASGLLAAGESRAWDVALAPGRYQVSCRIVALLPDGTLLDHYQLGMVAEVRVAEQE